MVCVSCGRTADPNRSFCNYCGSAVFVTGPQRSARGSVVFARPSSSSIPDSRGLSSGPGARKVSTFPLVGFIKLLVFGYIVWWVGSALLTVPEVRLMWDQLQRGETVTTEPAVNRFKRELGVTPEPPAYAPRSPLPMPGDGAPRTVPPTAEAPVTPAPPVAPPREEVPREAAVPTPTPRGVFLPGNGVTTPRAIERHLPSYTRQARLAKIEGTVRLRGVVQPDGRVTDVEVVKSLDQQFGLDRAAVSALEQWRFEPGVRSGRPVPVLVHVDLTFKLPE